MGAVSSSSQGWSDGAGVGSKGHCLYPLLSLHLQVKVVSTSPSLSQVVFSCQEQTGLISGIWGVLRPRGWKTSSSHPAFFFFF